MEDDDFGDLYTDVEPQRENKYSRGVSLQVSGQNIYNDYDEDEDEVEVGLYTSLKDAVHSDPKERTLNLSSHASAIETFESCEKDSEELLLYGLLDDGSFQDGSKEQHSFVKVENQHSIHHESPSLKAIEAFEDVKDGEKEKQKEMLHDRIVAEDKLEHFEEQLKVESSDDTDNTVIGKDSQELKKSIINDDEEEEGDFGAEITPPGLSLGANIPDFSAEDEVEEDWAQKDVRGFGTEAGGNNDVDSDSEDDLKILLNDDNPMYASSERAMDRIVEGSEDEDEEDLVIVAGDEPPDDREWGEDQTQPLEASVPASSAGACVPGLVAGAPMDERGQGSKANSSAGGSMSAPRLGYSGKPYHPQPHHSQFKYVRPGLTPVGGPNSSTTTSAQATVPGPKIPSGTGSWASGRGVGGPSMSGRGDWGGAGRSSGSQRPILGAGMLFGHNARNFQYGMEFSLPPSKSVFDIDLDAFEDKPWRHPNADITDYFNFNFNESSWKQYCSQLAQLRLEATMQSKIRVYVSGRSDQEYDPDLPPELRAAAGVHEGSGEINHAQSRMQDNGHHSIGGRGQGAGRGRGMFPIGRAIQVEGGGAERIPSSDLRRQRVRDFDSVIQIVLHDPEAEEENDGPDVVEETPAPAEQALIEHDEDYEDDDEEKKSVKFEKERRLYQSGNLNQDLEPVLNSWGRNNPRGVIPNVGPRGRSGLSNVSLMDTDGQGKFHSGPGRPGESHPDHIPDYGILPGPPFGPPPMARGGIGRPIYGGPRPGMPLPGLLSNAGMPDRMRPVLPRVDYNESARQRVPRILTPPHRLSSQGRVHDSDEEHSKSSEVQRGSKGSRARSESKEQNNSQQEWHKEDVQRTTTPALEALIDQDLEQDNMGPLHCEVLDQRKRSLSQDNQDDDEGLDAHSEERNLQQISKRQKIYTLDDRSKSGSDIMKPHNASESETSKDVSESSQQHSSQQSVEEENSNSLLKEKLSAPAVNNSDDLERDVLVKEWEPSNSRLHRPEGDTRVMRQERVLRKEGRRDEWYELRPFRQREDNIGRSAKVDHMMDRRGMVERDVRLQRREEEPLSKKKEDDPKRRDHPEEHWHWRERERERERDRERDRERERERERDDVQLKERREVQRRKAEEDMYHRQRKEDESARDPEKERDELLKERRDLQRRKTMDDDVYHRQRKEDENARDAKIRRHNENKFWPAYNRDETRARQDIRPVQGARDDYAKDRHRSDNQRPKLRERSDQLRDGDGRTRHFDVRNELVEEDHKMQRDRNTRHDGTVNIRKGYPDPQRQADAPSPYKDRHRWTTNLTKGGEQGRNGSRSMMHEYASKHSSGSKKLKIEDYQRKEFNDKAYSRISDDKGADTSRPGRMDKRSLGQKSSHGVARRSKVENHEAHFLSKDEDYPQNRSLSFEDDHEDRRKGRSKLERWSSQKEKAQLSSKVTSKDEKMKALEEVQHSGTQIDDRHKEEMTSSNKRHRVDRKRDRSQEDQSQLSETGVKDPKLKHHVLLPHASSSQEQEKHLKEDGKEDLASEALDDPSEKVSKKEGAEEHFKDRQQRQSDMAASLARRKERFRLQAKNDSDSERKHMQVDDEMEQKQEQNRQSEIIEEVKQERPARKRRWGGG
ncbi:hypothetical protein O6H91_07G010100 [Diphasiastrum complanatum]|uniref:Uncharacterized protein n=9 Tax=Diphasiastrum complanatum TaxID=34168 RepID=A0ACC2D2K1_DIPCM|nr:hypothetical protein O6H91_07G010100 [Diphasiastrum complanatum]KAJ7548390.1 hypothetical protein O6H91_07G010100 [Diphasiastrum complanatum]KAJ7548391.1 hypothetical protein O6H91_07G010100 [Diphasiastrum complanatum]KAJ7548392.1 hypothetical protein O6H91_07G010100 [Diphasiastrum complanatum]KAJ7548393.1 hypothetical protein O6H91_07G010100 [Diphasiastrum complanatum]